MTNLTDLDPGTRFPRFARFIVEIPKNSTNKYEFDKELGLFRLDRPLYSPLYYPGDYGFIPGTTAPDGDCLDVLTWVEYASFSGCFYEIRPVGVLNMVDQGKTDQKILAVPAKDPRFGEIQRVTDVFPHKRKEIEHFFTIYKQLENKKTSIHGWQSHQQAQTLMLNARANYLKSRPPRSRGVHGARTTRRG